jgi:hypothetical protein
MLPGPNKWSKATSPGYLEAQLRELQAKYNAEIDRKTDRAGGMSANIMGDMIREENVSLKKKLNTYKETQTW